MNWKNMRAGERRKFARAVEEQLQTKRLCAVMLTMAVRALPVFMVALLGLSAYAAASSYTGNVGSSSHLLVAFAAPVLVGGSLNDLRQQRGSIVEQMKALVNKADSEKRPLTAEEDAKWNAMDKDQEAIKSEILRRERQAALDAEMNATAAPNLSGINGGGKNQSDEQKKLVDAAFLQYIRGGMRSLNAEQRRVMEARVDHDAANIKAAQTITTTGGGYLIPQGFSNQLEEAMKWYGGMMQAADVFDTEAGNPLPWPTVDDTSNTGELLGINTQASQQDFTFGQVMFNAYMYSSKIVLVPFQLLQDSAFDINKFLARKLGERLGRIVNTHCTTGTGSGQPNGVVTAATLGKTGTTGQTTSVIYDDLVDLEHSVDPAHRQSPKCGFMLHDNSLKVIKKLKDSNGRPLWQAGLNVSGLDAGKSNPDTINGYPYAINQDVATMAANAKSILFGDFEKYKIRRVTGFGLLRLTERYADYLQVGFLAYARFDGNLVDAGSHPIKYYANSAT